MFIKIWSVCSCEFKANFYHLVFHLETIRVKLSSIIWEEYISILAENLNPGLSYLILEHCKWRYEFNNSYLGVYTSPFIKKPFARHSLNSLPWHLELQLTHPCFVLKGQILEHVSEKWVYAFSRVTSIFFVWTGHETTYTTVCYAYQGICWKQGKTSKLSPVHSIT